ncbi:MAG: hypothetical protein AAFP77_01990 [Bacteroidota bacterium]
MKAPKKSKSPIQSKLLHLIFSLNLSQQRDIQDFALIRSNQLSLRDQQILKELLTERKSFMHKQEDEIWEAVLEGSEKENKKRNRIKNRLLRTVERYLAMLQLDQHTALRNLVLSRHYTTQGILKNATLLHQSSVRNLEQSDNFEDSIYLFCMHEIALHNNKDIRRQDKSLDGMEKSLSDFYIGHRLRLMCEIANRIQIIGGENRIPEFRKELAYLTTQTTSEHILIYVSLFEMITQQQVQYYREIEAYLVKNQNKLKTNAVREFYVYLINFCIRQLNQGDIEFARKYLHFFALLEKKGWLLENGNLGVGRLQNSILAAIITDRLEWAKEKLDQYKDNLAADKTFDRKAFISLNMATIELHNGDLDRAHIYAKEFMDSNGYRKDLYYKLSCDKLLLKLFYLGEEYEAAVNKIRNIKAYIEHKQLPEARKPKPLHFLRIVERLINRKTIDEVDLQNRLLIPDYLWYQKFIKKE